VTLVTWSTIYRNGKCLNLRDFQPIENRLDECHSERFISVRDEDVVRSTLGSTVQRMVFLGAGTRTTGRSFRLAGPHDTRGSAVFQARRGQAKSALASRFGHADLVDAMGVRQLQRFVRPQRAH
jgi:hypothetical protein